MGAENSRVSASGDPSTNGRPLTYHKIHTKNVVVDDNDPTYALRKKSFNDGITFGSRPVGANEYVRIQLAKNNKEWNGCVRIGFTTVNPATMNPDSIPTNTCPDLIRKRGYWASAVKEEHSRIGNILHFFFAPNGTAYFGCNGKEFGVLFKGIPLDVPIWPIIDIYGGISGVRILNRDGACSLTTDKIISENFVLKFYSCLSLKSLMFHKTCGANIDWSGNIVKRKTPQENDNIVFSASPLTLDTMWVGVIASIDINWEGRLTIGATHCNPNSLSAASIASYNNNYPPYSKSFQLQFSNPNLGDELALCITNAGLFQVALNGETFSTMLDNIKINQSLWIFLNLGSSINQLKSCGTFHIVRSILPSLPDIECAESDKKQKPGSKKAPLAPKSGPSSLATDDGVDNKCSICMDRDRNVAFDPCGHLAACFECSENLSNSTKQCPICMQKFNRIMKIFFP